MPSSAYLTRSISDIAVDASKLSIDAGGTIHKKCNLLAHGDKIAMMNLVSIFSTDAQAATLKISPRES